jgi:flagellar biosynthetic protein FlhB
MAQSDLDRNHAATPYKLAKAHERGQAAKSPDVISAVVFVSAMVYLTWQGWPVWRDLFRLDQLLLVQAGRIEVTSTVMWSLVQRMIRDTLLLSAPFLVTLVISAVVGNLIQTGPILSAEPIKPDWERINPVAGFKRIFSMRTLFLAARALLKLLLLGLVVYFALKGLLPQFFHLAGLSALGAVRALLDDFASVGLRLGGMLALIALLDLIYTRHEFAKKMRMSNKEVKDEAKNREGDPRIRARLRELRRDMLKRSLALRKTRHADVLITNPTHVAVALRYVHGEMNAPQLVAKGRGFMAAAMRQIAARHRIPVVQSPSLARALYRDLGIDQHVQPDLYASVARIIVWVFARRDAMNAGASVNRPAGRGAAA